jgi:diguanylate cyclase (GGDEF)-like protein/PAS domain S-box-containing protein
VCVGSRPVVAGSDASIVLEALPVGLQVWDSAGDRGAVLSWANRDDDEARGAEAARAAFAGETVDAVEPYRDGWCRVRAQTLGDGRVLVSFEDVSELAAAERLSSSIVACLHQALIVVNAEGRITRSNEAAAELCGVSLGELTGSRLRDLPIKVFGRDGQPLDPTGSPIFRALSGDSVGSLLVQIERSDGTRRWVDVSSCPLTEPDGTSYGAMSTYTDVTRPVEREQRIRHEADTDDLTGVANRRALQRMLEAALGRAESHGLIVGVLMLDLDGFKAVNDRLGHAAGDAALRDVATRLRRSVRERDLVARTGGDEFVIVLADLAADENAAHDAAERVRSAFVTPLVLEGEQVRLHASVGVACFPADGRDGDRLLLAADRAMYARKAR